MKIMLIGMSGIGKTFWSKKLEKELSFARIGCDDQINKVLAKKLEVFGVKNDFKSISVWRGQPYEAGFLDKQKVQIETEIEVMQAVLQQVLTSDSENLVVDASGSVIYALPETLRQLSDLVECVYIRADDDEIDSLYTEETVFEKPLIWGNAFSKKFYESNDEAMRRSFRDVLSWRMSEYEKLAKHVIPNKVARSLQSAQEFLDCFLSR